MDNRLFLLLHVTSVILLSGVTFAAFAAPQSENRRPSLMMSGVLSLLVFLTGFGILGGAPPGWAIVKVVCWLVLSGLTGMAVRMMIRMMILLRMKLLRMISRTTMTQKRRMSSRRSSKPSFSVIEFV